MTAVSITSMNKLEREDTGLTVSTVASDAEVPAAQVWAYYKAGLSFEAITDVSRVAVFRDTVRRSFFGANKVARIECEELVMCDVDAKWPTKGTETAVAVYSKVSFASSVTLVQFEKASVASPATFPGTRRVSCRSFETETEETQTEHMLSGAQRAAMGPARKAATAKLFMAQCVEGASVAAACALLAQCGAAGVEEAKQGVTGELTLDALKLIVARLAVRGPVDVVLASAACHLELGVCI